MLKQKWARLPKTPDAGGNYCCSGCKQWKSPTEFNKNKGQKSGLNYLCKPCARDKVREYNLPTKYGITISTYAAMLLAQDGKCACCGTQFVVDGKKTDRACVDHNHKTGEVRSLLCGRCNLAAGNVQDSSEMAKKLVVYLEQWKC